MISLTRIPYVLLVCVSISIRQPTVNAQNADTSLPPVVLNNGEAQLFVDDYLIATQTALKRTLRQPKKDHSGNQPVLAIGDEFGETKSTLEANGTIVFDSRLKKWVMYCLAFASSWPGESADRVRLYRFTSHDALKWVKGDDGTPQRIAIDLYDAASNTRATNIDLFSCTYDATNSDYPYQGWLFFANWGPGREGTYHVQSPDGIHWQRGVRVLTAGSRTIEQDGRTMNGTGDVTTFYHDPKQNRYLACLRFASATDVENTNRLRSRGFLFTRQLDQPIDLNRLTRLNLIPEGAMRNGDMPTDEYYSSTAWRYGSLWLGGLRIWHSRDDYPYSAAGCAFLKLVVSRDGLHWKKVPFLNDSGDPEVFILNGKEGEIEARNDGGYMTEFSNPPLRIGDELIYYYGSSSWGKNHPRPYRVSGGGVFRARLRLDGFVSVDAGSLVTRKLKFDGRELTVNAIGPVKIEIVNSADPNAAPIASTTIQGDSVRHRVVFDRNRTLGDVAANGLAQIRFSVEKNGSLYSFTIDDDGGKFAVRDQFAPPLRGSAFSPLAPTSMAGTGSGCFTTANSTIDFGERGRGEGQSRGGSRKNNDRSPATAIVSQDCQFGIETEEANAGKAKGATTKAVTSRGLLKFEPFDRDPRWSGVNHRSAREHEPIAIRQDFGYSASTSFAGGLRPGEVGGFITPAAEAAFYGKPIAAADLNQPLTASGTMMIAPGGTHLLLGFFNSRAVNEWRTPNTVGIRLNGRGENFFAYVEYCTSKWRAGGDTTPFPSVTDPNTGRWNLIGYPCNKSLNWTLAYDPRGNNGNGIVTATIGQDTALCKLDATHKADGATFDRFGILNVMKSADSGSAVWFDDIAVQGAEANEFSNDPQWEGRNNRRIFPTRIVRPWFDFGYSQTNFAGGKASGEVGGQVFRGDCRKRERMACYGDPLGPLSLNGPIQASGRITLRRAVSDSTTLFGFYHSLASMRQNESQSHGLPESVLGIHIEGPSSEGFKFYPVLRTRGGDSSFGNVRESPTIYPDGTSHEWSLTYDPQAADGHGRIVVSLAERFASWDLPPGTKNPQTVFDRFGIVTSWIDGNSQDVYWDDLTYTAAQE